MKQIVWLVSLSFGLAIGSLDRSYAQDAESLLKNPSAQDFEVSVYTGRDLSGEKQPIYDAGGKIKIAVRSNQDTYIYLFHIDSADKVNMLLPNLSAGGHHFVKAQQTKYFPSLKNEIPYTVGSRPGTDKLLVLATKQKLDLNDIFVFKGKMATSQVKGQAEFLKSMQRVLMEMPPRSWTADTAYYKVAGAQEVISYKTLPQISSDEALVLLKVNQWRDTYLNWQTKVDTGVRLTSVFKHYDAQLISAGFRRTTIERKSVPVVTIKGTYVGSENKKAFLWVDQKENHFHVAISVE